MKLNKVGEDKKTGRLAFTLEDSNHGFANALRRSIMEEVPIMAIDKVEIRNNSSILYDEMLAHRLGLVPLITDLKGYTMPDACTCGGEGCAKCMVTLTLKTDKEGTITADALQSNDPKVKAAQPQPIVKLFKGQDVDVVCYARLGRGKHHMKWSPGLAWYRYKRNVKGAKGAEKEAIEYGPYHDTEPEGVEISESDKDFVFFVEPWGQLNPQDIVTEALEQLTVELDTFDKVFQSL